MNTHVGGSAGRTEKTSVERSFQGVATVVKLVVTVVVAGEDISALPVAPPPDAVIPVIGAANVNTSREWILMLKGSNS